jgi:hypothetical protein
LSVKSILESEATNSNFKYKRKWLRFKEISFGEVCPIKIRFVG